MITESRWTTRIKLIDIHSNHRYEYKPHDNKHQSPSDSWRHNYPDEFQKENQQAGKSKNKKAGVLEIIETMCIKQSTPTVPLQASALTESVTNAMKKNIFSSIFL